MSTEPDGGTPKAQRQWWWRSAALLVFCLALVTPFHEVWQGDLTEVVPLFPRFEGELTRELKFTRTGYEIDTRFHVFGVVRNARALLSDPSGLYDTEQCYPSTGTLALGEPMITLGILAMPAYLLTGDPVATYNLVLLLIVLLSAIGMYLLVTEWSGLPAAGIVAGLLYAFHPAKLNDIAHPFINDTVWTVLALLFARRFFARGRWLDAIALAICSALQIAGSYYPFLSATLLALPMLVWLFVHYGVRELRVAPCLCAAAIILLAGLAVFAPYLELHRSLGLPERHYQAFETWQSLLPGGARFPGWVLLGLVVACLGLRRRDALGGLAGDPRWALSIGCLLIAATAVGHFQPSPLPNLYAAFASFVPGMSSVRRPGELMSGVHLTLSILSGLGAAALLRRTPRVPARYLAGALIIVTYLVTLRPGFLGLEPPVVYSALEIRPSDEKIAFFRRLD